MSHLVFMMGEFEARFPTDRRYAKNHMWARAVDADGQNRDPSRQPSQRLRCGFTAYAVRLLQDVYFLDWSVEPGAALRARQEIGFIESKKAESSLYAPFAGVLAEFNAELLSDPSAINVSGYERGWLFELAAETPELLTPEEYITHLEQAWVTTQRAIKGQMNE